MTCKFTIKITPSVISGGEIIDEPIFDCEFLSDRNVDIHDFADKLFSFWQKQNIMWDAQEKWEYEYSIVQL